MLKQLKLLVLLVVMTSCSFAQRSDTIYQTLATNILGCGGNCAPSLFFGPVRNIGQSQHMLYVLGRNSAVGQDCAANQHVSIYFEASFDGTNYFPLSKSKMLLLDTTNLSAYLTTTGLAPFIRVRVDALSIACRADIYYAGSLHAVNLNKLEMVGHDNGIETLLTQLAQNETFPIDHRYIYGLVCSYSATTPALMDIGDFHVTLSAGNTLVWPNTGLPYMHVNTSESGQLNGTIKNNGTGTLYCLIQFRRD